MCDNCVFIDMSVYNSQTNGSFKPVLCSETESLQQFTTINKQLTRMMGQFFESVHSQSHNFLFVYLLLLKGSSDTHFTQVYMII